MIPFSYPSYQLCVPTSRKKCDDKRRQKCDNKRRQKCNDNWRTVYDTESYQVMVEYASSFGRVIRVPSTEYTTG